MKKMECLFQREYISRNKFTLLPIVTPGCEWVLAGEGTPTVKWDGTACAVIGGKLYARYDAHGKSSPPEGAVSCYADENNNVAGHKMYWVPVQDQPQFVWHREAWKNDCGVSDSWPNGRVLLDGTYELIGPKVNGNAHDYPEHTLIRHGWVSGPEKIIVVPELTYAGIKAFLAGFDYEGLVFWHPDGRMCKIRRKDYGFTWPVRATSKP